MIHTDAEILRLHLPCSDDEALAILHESPTAQEVIERMQHKLERPAIDSPSAPGGSET